MIIRIVQVCLEIIDFFGGATLVNLLIVCLSLLQYSSSFENPFSTPVSGITWLKSHLYDYWSAQVEEVEEILHADSKTRTSQLLIQGKQKARISILFSKGKFFSLLSESKSRFKSRFHLKKEATDGALLCKIRTQGGTTKTSWHTLYQKGIYERTKKNMLLLLHN